MSKKNTICKHCGDTTSFECTCGNSKNECKECHAELKHKIIPRFGGAIGSCPDTGDNPIMPKFRAWNWNNN